MDETMRARLTDPKRGVRLTAIDELSGRQDAQALKLLNLALGDKHPVVRLRAIDALRKVGTPEALDVLLARMDDPAQSTMLRRLIFDAVIRIGTPEAADALEARMDDYSSGRARRIVSRKIAKMRAAH